MYILSLGCLGGGCIFPISLCYRSMLQERPTGICVEICHPRYYFILGVPVKGGYLRIGAFEREVLLQLQSSRLKVVSCGYVHLRERDREAYPRMISQHTHDLLMEIGLLKFYQENISLRWKFVLLQQLIRRWDHGRQGIRVDSDTWYHPTKEDGYFITGLSRMGVCFTHFPVLPPGAAGDT
jgi:hypothetical protein